MFLAVWIVKGLLAFKPPIDFPLSIDLALDWRVLLFSLGVSLVAGTVFGLAPALQSTRPNLLSALKDTSAQGGAGRTRLRSVLVVAQIAISLIVLVAAGLVVRTLQQLQTMNPGFDPQNALTMSFDLGLQGYDDARGQQFYRQIAERVRALPGVKSAAVSSYAAEFELQQSKHLHRRRTHRAGRDAAVVDERIVGPRYFETMATPIVAGREFTEQDVEKSEQVAVVNETFVHRYMPAVSSPADAVGKRFSFGDASGPFMRIVGVAKDGKYFNIAEDPHVRLDGDGAGALVEWRVDGAHNGQSGIAVRGGAGEVQALDPTLPVFEVKTLTEHLRLALFPARIAAMVLGVFGLVALLLSAIGIYGITSYTVAQRTHEIGIRLALGAQWGDVLRLVLNHGLKLTLIGSAIGLVGAYLATRAITSVLW